MEIDINNVNKIENPDELFRILAEMMEYLRSKDGCIWDREQTHDSIKKNLIEESYEAIEAIENKDCQSLKEELGDILLQVVFHSQIASENNDFKLSDVLKGIINKLYRRHPHVFGDKVFSDSKDILTNWEEIKKVERESNPKKTKSIFNDIPKIMPSLHYANEIQKRAARLGFDWENARDILAKVKEEFDELNNIFFKYYSTGNTAMVKNTKSGNLEDSKLYYEIMAEIGDILFSIVNLSRRLGIDSEDALKLACKKFVERFNKMEKLAEKRMLNFKDLTIDDKDKLWNEVKLDEKLNK
jgi:tetrapyrrole methylase family protein/MazG family protein